MSLEYVPLGEIADITKLAGFEFTKYIDYLEHGDIIALRALNLRNGSLDLTDVKYISKEVSESLPRSKLYKNDILLTYTGNGYGDCAIVKENDKYHLAPNIAKITPKNVNPYYLFEYINSKFFKKQMRNYIGGSSQPTIPMKTLRILEIPIFDNNTQNKVAKILSDINKKIQINKEINKNLRNLIKILYKDYFEVKTIPKGWKLINIESIVNVYNGYSYKGNELHESDCGMVTIKNFNRDGSFRIDGFKEIVYSNKIKNYHFINENDVLISCTDVTQDADIIGNCIILLDKQNYKELIMSMDLVKIESKIPEINNFLLATIFKSYNFKKHILGYVNGTTVLHLDKKGIKKFQIALPENLAELKKISKRFEIIYKEIQCNQKEIYKLVKLRDTLLPKLMSGEIDVSKINI